MLIRVFPNGCRDFVFQFWSSTDEVHPTGVALPFLYTELAPLLVERVEQSDPECSRLIFLAQILVNCLIYRGNRRHLVVESWDQNDLEGNSLRNTPSQIRMDLAREQCDEFRLVSTGESPPTGTLAEVFWDAHVTTPRLPAVFEDAQMGEMALAILRHLNPNERTQNELAVTEIRSAIDALWQSHFDDLGLAIPTRETRRVFKRLMSAAIRYASQFNGIIARTCVIQSIGSGDFGSTEVSEREERLLELRYGGVPAFEDINVCLLYCEDGLYSTLINDYAQSLVFGSDADVEACEDSLHRYLALLRSFRDRRRAARRIERRERRQQHQDYLPAARIEAQDQPDVTAPDPSVSELPSELIQRLLPLLHERDRRKLEALMDADWDRALAAESLGMTRTQLSRQVAANTQAQPYSCF